jgi:tetratricopeptide (TPR) repeat protein
MNRLWHLLGVKRNREMPAGIGTDLATRTMPEEPHEVFSTLAIRFHPSVPEEQKKAFARSFQIVMVVAPDHASRLLNDIQAFDRDAMLRLLDHLNEQNSSAIAKLNAEPGLIPNLAAARGALSQEYVKTSQFRMNALLCDAACRLLEGERQKGDASARLLWLFFKSGLAQSLRRVGHHAAAISHFAIADEELPKLCQAHGLREDSLPLLEIARYLRVNYGVAASRTGRHALAIDQFEKAWRIYRRYEGGVDDNLATSVRELMKFYTYSLAQLGRPFESLSQSRVCEDILSRHENALFFASQEGSAARIMDYPVEALHEPWIIYARYFFVNPRVALLDEAAARCQDPEIAAILRRTDVREGHMMDAGAISPTVDRLFAERRLPAAAILEMLALRGFMVMLTMSDGYVSEIFAKLPSEIDRTRLLAEAETFAQTASNWSHKYKFAECYGLLSRILGVRAWSAGDGRRAQALLMLALNSASLAFQIAPAFGHLEYLNCAHNYANVLDDLGEHEAAEVYLQRAIATIDDYLPSPMPLDDEINTWATLSVIQANRGHLRRARKSIDTGLGKIPPGSTHRQPLDNKRGLLLIDGAKIDMQLREYGAAAAKAREASALYATLKSSNEEDYTARHAHASCLEAEILEQLGRQQEAIDLLEGTVRDLDRSGVAQKPAIRRELAISLCLAAGALSEAANSEDRIDRYLTRAEECIRQRGDGRDPIGNSLRLMLQRTKIRCLLHRADAPETLLDEAVTIAEEAHPSYLHKQKGMIESVYRALLSKAVHENNAELTMSYLLALSSARVQARSGAALADLQAAIGAAARANGTGITVLFARSLDRDTVVFGGIGPDGVTFVALCGAPATGALRTFELAAKAALFGRMDRDSLATAASAAWKALPERVCKALNPGEPGEVFLCMDSGWSMFPWEALAVSADDAGWLGLHRHLARIGDLSAEGLETLKPVSVGDANNRAAVICPYDATAVSLTFALGECQDVGVRLQGCGYRFSQDSGLLIGAAATGASFRSALETRPAIVHFSGHGDFDSGDQYLVLHGDGACDLVGVGDLGGLSLRSENGPGAFVFLGACNVGRSMSEGGKRGDLVAELLTIGAEAVVASAMPIYDDIGAQIGRLIYAQDIDRTGGLGRTIVSIRQRLWREHRDTGRWAAWMFLSLHGNPYCSLARI